MMWIPLYDENGQSQMLPIGGPVTSALEKCATAYQDGKEPMLSDDERKAIWFLGAPAESIASLVNS